MSTKISESTDMQNAKGLPKQVVAILNFLAYIPRLPTESSESKLNVVAHLQGKHEFPDNLGAC